MTRSDCAVQWLAQGDLSGSHWHESSALDMSVQGGAHGAEYIKLMGETWNNYIRYQSVTSRKALAYLLVAISMRGNLTYACQSALNELNMQLELIKESFWQLSTLGCTKHGWTKSGDEQTVTQQVGQSIDCGRDSPAIRRGLSTKDRHGNRVNLVKICHISHPKIRTMKTTFCIQKMKSFFFLGTFCIATSRDN